MAELPRQPNGSAWVSTEASAHLAGRVTRDTAPEVALRSAVHRLGLRFRNHQRLVGRSTVDFVLPRHRVAVLVDGCFWHGCPQHGTRSFRGPNRERWEKKIQDNQQRDARNTEALAAAGWSVVRFWECEVKADAGACAAEVLRRTHASN